MREKKKMGEKKPRGKEKNHRYEKTVNFQFRLLFSGTKSGSRRLR